MDKSRVKRMIVSTGVFLLGTHGAFAAAEPLKGVDCWAGIPRHPAVVNAVGYVSGDPDILSLRGAWEYAKYKHGSGWRQWGFPTTNDWPVVGTLNVPGCWEAQGVGEPKMGEPYLCQDQAPKMVRQFFRGEIWYRKTVEIPSSWSGKRIWFKTGGLRSQGWVWVNDHPVAWVRTFCAAWKYDITPFVKPGEKAKIVVIVSNAQSPRNVQLNCANRWGGPWRDLELEATPTDCYIDDAWVRGDFDKRSARVNVEIGGEVEKRGGGGQRNHSLSLRATVEGETAETPLPSSTSTSSLHLEVPLRNFRPWSPEHPNLYWAKIELVDADGAVLQTRRERFGVRKLEVRGKEFYLNNAPFYIRGYGDDSAYPLTGHSPADRAYHLEHLKRARAAGFNFVRHHTHAEVAEHFEAADEAGILVQPEMSYYMDNPEDDFDYDPLADVYEIWRTYRRHPSFGSYSGGNEGSLGPAAGKMVYDWIRAHDPDRLSIEQDGGMYLQEGFGVGRSTHCTGPLKPWERGSFNPRAFYAHEYLNLCVKFDWRTENDYTGVLMPPVTAADRARWLKRSGLSLAWGERLQDAQHALQKFWQKQGIEQARMDPFADGYCFWTIADVVVWNGRCETYSAQGLFDQFWRPKRGGATPEDFAAFNSPSCILLDTEGKGDRTYREHSTYEDFNNPWVVPDVIENTNRVFVAGERIPADFILAHYDRDLSLANATLAWKFVTASGETVASGTQAIGDQPLGPARLVHRTTLAAPEVDCPRRLRLVASVGPVVNAWDFWIFPKTERRTLPKDVSLVAYGSPEMASALAAGGKVIALANQSGPSNVMLGWWQIGSQAGTAFLDHPALRGLPSEPYLCPLHFRLMKQGLKLPVAGVSEKDLIVVGEGGDACYLYLSKTVKPNGAVLYIVAGLDVTSGTPEGNALLNGIIADLEK